MYAFSNVSVFIKDEMLKFDERLLLFLFESIVIYFYSIKIPHKKMTHLSTINLCQFLNKTQYIAPNYVAKFILDDTNLKENFGKFGPSDSTRYIDRQWKMISNDSENLYRKNLANFCKSLCSHTNYRCCVTLLRFVVVIVNHSIRMRKH